MYSVEVYDYTKNMKYVLDLSEVGNFLRGQKIEFIPSTNPDDDAVTIIGTEDGRDVLYYFPDHVFCYTDNGTAEDFDSLAEAIEAMADDYDVDFYDKFCGTIRDDDTAPIKNPFSGTTRLITWREVRQWGQDNIFFFDRGAWYIEAAKAFSRKNAETLGKMMT